MRKPRGLVLWGTLRVVLIFDAWNPALSAAERDRVGGLVNAIRDYYAADG